jgi:hypothetical protein
MTRVTTPSRSSLPFADRTRTRSPTSGIGSPPGDVLGVTVTSNPTPGQVPKVRELRSLVVLIAGAVGAQIGFGRALALSGASTRQEGALTSNCFLASYRLRSSGPASPR